MDPDANIRAQIAVLRELRKLRAADYHNKPAIRAAQDEYTELRHAYFEWRRNGGFPATDYVLAERDSYLSLPSGP